MFSLHPNNQNDNGFVCFSKNEHIRKLKFHADKYHWSDEKKRSADYLYLEQVYQLCLPVLANALNKAHDVSRSYQYWETIIGYWLVVYISVMFDRSEMINSTVTSLHKEKAENFTHNFFSPPKDVNDYVDLAANSDAWNRSVLNIFKLQPTEALKDLNFSILPYQQPDLKLNNCLVKKFRNFEPKVFLRNLVSRIFGIFGGFDRQKIIFFASYFSPLELLKIEWIARNDVAFYHFHSLSRSSFLRDPHVRTCFESAVDGHNVFADQFVGVIIKYTSRFIPLSYLEEYKSRCYESAKVNPIPNQIFTANGHFSDDTFKIWAAEMRTKGAKLCISEHGGSFPARDYLFRVEEKISDLYIVGWPKSHLKHKELPLSTYCHQYPLVVNKIGDKLIIITYPGTKWALRASSQPQSYRAFSVLSMIEALVNGLDEPIKKKSTIKLANSQKPWNLLENAYKSILENSVLISREPLHKLFKTARVVICTYPQTTFTNAILSGVPVIMLYDPKISVIEDSGCEIISDMLRYKMCFHDAAKAARHLNEIWADPLVWWNSGEVMNVRNHFNKYAMLDTPKKTQIWAKFFISPKSLYGES